MKISNEGLEMIKEFEGYRKEAYLCSARVATIGYGTTKYVEGDRVKLGDMIDKTTAIYCLENDLKWAENAVNKKVEVQISQNMYDALVSFVYNLGSSIFQESKCTLLRKLNAQDYTGASNEFKRWNRAGRKVVKGLSKRRYKESCHFVGI
jgi:lysozyme